MLFRKSGIGLLVVLSLSMVLSACSGRASGTSITAVPMENLTTQDTTSDTGDLGEGEPESNTSVSLAEILGNLSYSGIFPDQPITLVDGFYSYDDGSPAKPFVRFIPQLIATGDINGDGLEDAMVLLEDQSSGTGDFIYLSAVLDALGNPKRTLARLVRGQWFYKRGPGSR